MMSLVEFFSQPVWHRLSLTLVHFLWQGVAVAVVACAAVRLLRFKRGNPRYGAYLLAFAVMAVCPPVTFTLLATRAAPAVIAPGPMPKIESSGPVPRSVAYEPRRQPSEDTPPIGLMRRVSLQERLDAALQTSLPWMLVCWLGGVLVLSVRLLLGFIGVRRWRRNLEPLAEGLQARVALLTERLGMPGFSRVFTSRRAQEAVALGHLRPMILLPTALLTQMSPEMLEAIIAHELAHIRRLDLWVNLAQRVVETLLFYHPAVWWLSNRLRGEREFCCDELAVTVTGERLAYASALENATRVRSSARQPALATGLGQGERSTLGRIRHILGLSPMPPDSRFWLAGFITFVVLLLLAIPTVSVLTVRAESQPTIKDKEADRASGHPLNLGPRVNSADYEWDPCISVDGLSLYFLSRRPGGLGDADIWVTTRETGDEPWGTPVNLGSPINSPAFEGAPCLSADGLELYFMSDRPGGYGGCDLWVSERPTVEDAWLAPVNLGPGVNSPLSENGPSISADGLSLYFSEHIATGARPGGHGGADIWVTTRKSKNGPWGTPVNLGPMVNGPDADASPSISMDALSLFFMSDRPGFGKTDIWVTTRKSQDDPWGPPVNLGPPINTIYGEWNPAVSGDGSTLYFASGRDGSARTDIWRAALKTRSETTMDAKTRANSANLLREAAKAGDIEEIRRLITQGADVNGKNDRTGRTPLHLAACGGHTNVAELLLSAGANVDATNPYRYTPLHDAVRAGHTDVAELLVGKGADVNARDWRHGTPLHLAARTGNKETVELLLGKGADIHAKDKDGITPLFAAITACTADRRSIVEVLLSKGSSIPVFHLAAYMGDVERLDGLLQDGIDMNSQEGFGCTALHLAASSERRDIVELLISKGATVNTRDISGVTPLYYAFAQNDPNIAEVLLAHGADVAVEDKDGHSLLYYAVWNESEDAARLLIAKGVNVNAKVGGITPLHYAFWGGDVKMVKLLLANGADANTKDARGRTVLDLAQEHGSTEIAELLRRHGAKE